MTPDGRRTSRVVSAYARSTSSPRSATKRVLPSGATASPTGCVPSPVTRRASNRRSTWAGFEASSTWSSFESDTNTCLASGEATIPLGCVRFGFRPDGSVKLGVTRWIPDGFARSKLATVPSPSSVTNARPPAIATLAG